ncbi:DUF3150 domain-containing protein [Deltaproteobacteria bacterium Smac51]|nr:DUF3150 domain-containing protein [Deltaproteobacteria bacterium Smac51]
MAAIPCDMKILDRLVAVNLSVTIWTARRKLTAADFGGAELPPEELASWGSKKICDPEALRIFNTLKSRAVAHLDKIGVRFLGGWAIPEHLAQDAHYHLHSLKGKFQNAKDAFLDSYDQAVKDWVDRHPGWENLIATSTVGADYVRSRLSFDWQFYKVAAPEPGDVMADSLTGEVSTLGLTLFEEIAKEARLAWNKVYSGKTELSHKALSPLKTMHRKLVGLSFVEPRAAPAADLIEEAMRGVPKRGLISGPPLVMLQGLVSMLRDPRLLVEHGQKVIEGHSPHEVIYGLNRIADETIELEPADSNHSPEPPAVKPIVDSLGLW